MQLKHDSLSFLQDAKQSVVFIALHSLPVISDILSVN